MRRVKNVHLFVVMSLCVVYLLFSYRIINKGSIWWRYRGLDKSLPFIFIGGVPRSGVGLLSLMLDAHPSVRCGMETLVIPHVVDHAYSWKMDKEEQNRFQEAGLTEEVIEQAVASFIAKVIDGHGAPAHRLCNRDPLMIGYAKYISKLFPNARFIFVIRDGRATVHSIIKNKVTIAHLNMSDYRRAMESWNKLAVVFDSQCSAIGDKCLRVQYERLKTRSAQEMSRILSFLHLPWSDDVVIDENADKVGEFVEDNQKEWIEAFPQDVLREMPRLAPKLLEFGYNANEGLKAISKGNAELKK